MEDIEIVSHLLPVWTTVERVNDAKLKDWWRIDDAAITFSISACSCSNRLLTDVHAVVEMPEKLVKIEHWPQFGVSLHDLPWWRFSRWIESSCLGRCHRARRNARSSSISFCGRLIAPMALDLTCLIPYGARRAICCLVPRCGTLRDLPGDVFCLFMSWSVVRLEMGGNISVPSRRRSFQPVMEWRA